MPTEKKSSKSSKTEKINVKLTREFKSKDKVIYTNHGRFVPDEKGEVTLLINDGEQKIQAKAV